MKTRIILYASIFVLLTLILLIGGHFILYVFFVNTYNLYHSLLRVVLAIVFGIFSVGYILASIIARWSDNLITRTFYVASAVWLGLIWYVAISAALSLICFALFNFFGVAVSQSLVETFFLSCAIGYTVYGLWGAYALRVKKINIQIQNLPDAWNGKSVIQISDVHLGHVHGDRFFSTVISLVTQQSPDAVFITGDLFDGMGGDFRYIVKDINRIKAPLGVFYIKGNHETYMDFSVVESLIQKTKILFLHDDIRVVQGMQIVGADYPKFGAKRELKYLVSRVDPTLPSILLWHEPVDIETAKQAGISLVLSGHTHRGQMFPFELIARWVYKRYVYGLVVDGFFNHYTSSGVGTWGPPIRTGNRPEIVHITLHAA